MPVSILQWRAEIGIFNTKLVKYSFKSKYRANVCPRDLNKFYTICCMFLLLLICAGDIELNSIVEHRFSKLSLLEGYNVQHKFDMICLSETFLDSSIPTNDEKIKYERIQTDKS